MARVRSRVDVERKVSAHPSGDRAIRDKHPAFGVVRVSRCTGDCGPLFGSATPYQPGYIEVKVHEAEREHVLGQDWIFAGDLLFSWRMTHAALVGMMTTMNEGSGTPVTLGLRRCDDGSLEEYPLIGWPEESNGTEAHEALRSVEAQAKAITRSLAETEDEIARILDNAKVSKATRAAVLAALDKNRRAINSMPFFLGQVQEAGEKVVAAVKSEVDGLLTNAKIRLANRALKALEATKEPEE